MPNGQTLITYNEVELTNCVTEQFAQEAVFDPSGTDLLYHKFTVTVTGYCIGDNRSSNYTIDSFRKFAPGGQLPTSGDSPNPTVGEVWIRSHLEKPRHDFEMRTGVERHPDGTPDTSTGSVLL